MISLQLPPPSAKFCEKEGGRVSVENIFISKNFPRNFQDFGFVKTKGEYLDQI